MSTTPDIPGHSMPRRRLAGIVVATALAAAVFGGSIAEAQTASGTLVVQAAGADGSGFTYDISSVGGGEQRLERPFAPDAPGPLELPEGEWVLTANIGSDHRYEGWAVAEDDSCPGQQQGSQPTVPVNIVAGELTRICIFVSEVEEEEESPTATPTMDDAETPSPSPTSAEATRTPTGTNTVATTATPEPPETGSGSARDNGAVLLWFAMTGLVLATAGGAFAAWVMTNRR